MELGVGVETVIDDVVPTAEVEELSVLCGAVLCVVDAKVLVAVLDDVGVPAAEVEEANVLCGAVVSVVLGVGVAVVDDVVPAAEVEEVNALCCAVVWVALGVGVAVVVCVAEALSADISQTNPMAIKVTRNIALRLVDADASWRPRPDMWQLFIAKPGQGCTLAVCAEETKRQIRSMRVSRAHIYYDRCLLPASLARCRPGRPAVQQRFTSTSGACFVRGGGST